MLICVDLDGTLLDTVAANGASYRAALEEQGFTVTDEYYADHCNGGYYKQFLRPLMGGDPDPADVERVHDRKKELYGDFLGLVRPNRALFELLQNMRRRPPAGLRYHRQPPQRHRGALSVRVCVLVRPHHHQRGCDP